MSEILSLFDRARTSAVQRPSFDPKARLAQAADELNRAGLLQAQIGALEGALVAFINVLYATDADGSPANYDYATHRILIPVPWGERGWRAWGLRRWEAHCLRHLLIERSRGGRRRPPLFDYSDISRRWYLDAGNYPDTNAALRWVQRDGPQLAEWRSVVTESREQAATRMQRRRG